MTSTLRRALLPFAGFALLVAACGDSDTESGGDAASQTTAADPMDSMDSMGDGDHGGLREVDPATAPTVVVEVIADPKSGWNLHSTVTDFVLAPDDAGGDGHLHLYVDGEVVTQIYDEWFHLGALEPGTHEVRVELSASDHTTYALDGVAIGHTVVVEVPETGGDAHTHMDPMTVEAVEPHPALHVEVLPDPAGGRVLHTMVENFRLAPEHVSTEHVDGEGHMHLYIDGTKITRLYGEWYVLPTLDPGTHEIRVELSANDHSVMVIDDAPVEQVVTVEVDGAAADGHDHGEEHEHGSADEPSRFDADVADAVQTITLEVVGGAVVGGSEQIAVERGSVIALAVTSDTADTVHVHGYDILRALPAGETTTFAFTAEIPGVFEVELEDSGRLIVELEIS